VALTICFSTKKVGSKKIYGYRANRIYELSKTIFFFISFLLGYKTLFQFPGIFNTVFRPGLGFKPSLGYGGT
jgi:hypothetical protein